MIVLFRFHVYGTFYRHLFDKATQQMVAHESSPQKCNKNWKRNNCLRQSSFSSSPGVDRSNFPHELQVETKSPPSLEVVSQMEQPMSA